MLWRFVTSVVKCIEGLVPKNMSFIQNVHAYIKSNAPAKWAEHFNLDTCQCALVPDHVA